MINAVIIQPPGTGRNGIGKNPVFCRPHLKIVGRSSSIAEGILLVKSVKPNLVILDVEFPNGSGFKVFEETAEVAYEKIILCNHSGYAIKAARYHVADYLLKPLQEEEVIGAVEKIIFAKKQYKIQRRFEDEVGKRGQLRLERLLVPKMGDRRELVKVDDIIRITDESEFRLLHLQDGSKLRTPQKLSRIAYNLVLNHFFRIDNIAFNLNHVQSYLIGAEKSSLTMLDGFQVEVPLRLEGCLHNKLNLSGLDV